MVVDFRDLDSIEEKQLYALLQEGKRISHKIDNRVILDDFQFTCIMKNEKKKY